ncbi:hypothetical protein BH23GEM3_BH23GEM3_14510 [soil metagenome]
MKRSLRLFSALCLGFQISACERTPTEMPKPVEPKAAIALVSDFTPGRGATVRGQNLSRIEQFTVDGRQAPGVRLKLETTIRLRSGQSVEIRPEDLACLQIPSGTEE